MKHHDNNAKMGKTKKRKHEDSDANTLAGSHSHKGSEHKKSKKEKADKGSKEVKQSKEAKQHKEVKQPKDVKQSGGVKQPKSKHAEPPAPETSPPPSPRHASKAVSPPVQATKIHGETIGEQFDNFRCALRNLLSTSENLELRGVLGDRKANFLAALRTMGASGDLPWLSPPSTSDLSSNSDSDSSDSDTDGDSGSREVDNDSSPPPKILPKALPKTPSLPLGRPATLSTPTLNWPPPLPEVKNHKLRQQAFTHKSFIKGEEVSIPGTENRHYERLEFLGDSYLQSIASHILYDYFPTHREGALSEMRQSLVANRPLSTYATLYKFHLRIREGKGQENTAPVILPSAPPSISSVPRESPESESLDKEKEKAPTETNKTLADCFEAYIAALVLDDPVHGVQTARDWLEKLYAPKLAEFAKQYNIAPIDKMAKQTLNTIAGGSRVTIEYRWDGKHGGNKGGYSIEVYLTGWGFKERLIGKGWATNKNDAALRAAMNVIADKEFCEEMARIRLAVLGPKPQTTNTRTRRNPNTNTPTPPPALTSSSSSGPPQRAKNTKRPVARNADELNYDD